jgi:hypothetical protein
MSCEHCPIPESCLGKPYQCAWMAKEPRDPVQERSVINAARRAAGLPPISGQSSEYPSMATMAAHLAGAAARFVAGGLPLVDDAEFGRRSALCGDCPEYDHAHSRCRLCGCFLGAKLRAATEHCPLPSPKW